LTNNPYIYIFRYMDKDSPASEFSLKKIEILKVIAHPARMKILAELVAGVKCVSDFEGAFDMRQPAVSHHLSILRRYDLVDYFVDGRLKCYFLRDPMIPEIIKVLRREHTGDLPAPACCPVTKRGKYPGTRNTEPAKEHGARRARKASF
jgi:ArsR family transcriptional regulator